MSLLISLSCALAAMLLQQWTRMHLQRYSIHDEARMRAYFADGREVLDFPLAITCITFFVQLSIILFFGGILVYMYFANRDVFKIALAWTALCLLAFLGITLLPIFKPDTPFRTPFSNLVVLIYSAILRCGCRIFRLATCASGGSHQKDRHRDRASWNLVKVAEERVRKQSSKIDGTVLKRTLDTLRGDHDREQFFEAIPGFCHSEMVQDPQLSLDILGRERLAEALFGFLDRTLSSNLISESVKGRRLVICIRVIEATNLTVAVPLTLRALFSRGSNGISHSPEVSHFLGSLRDSKVASLARGIIAGTISSAERDGRWFTLAIDELATSKRDLRTYLAHGDSVLLANLIHITRHFFDSLLEGNRDLARESLFILPSISHFDILNTLPELQRDFCNLWNMIVQQAQNGRPENNPYIEILNKIQHLHIALHYRNATRTDVSTPTYNRLQQTPYLVCEIVDSPPNLTSPIPEESVDTTSDSGHAPMITSSTHPIPESLPPIDVLSTPLAQRVSVLASATSSSSSPPRSQSLPTISPSARPGTTEGLDEGSTGIQKESELMQNPA